jgi:Taurine catabolism dioxygenase TauD, TfdA family
LIGRARRARTRKSGLEIAFFILSRKVKVASIASKPVRGYADSKVTGLTKSFCRWDPYFVRSLTRFSDKGLVPPLSEKQKEAMQVLEDTCNRLALHMILEVGDIQFLSNAQVLHARTAYKDYPPPAPRRHLMRLWLSTPETEGGWNLPMPDTHEKKRGGIQVNNVAPRAPLDAE